MMRLWFGLWSEPFVGRGPKFKCFGQATAGVSLQRIVQGFVMSGSFMDGAVRHAQQPHPGQPDIDGNNLPMSSGSAITS